MSYLVARAALEAAQKMFEKARAGAKAAPGDKAKAKTAGELAASLTAAYTATIDAAAGEPSLQRKRDELITAKVIHHEKYEKKTVQTDDKPDDAPASGVPGSAEGGESSAGADAAPATVDSARPSGIPAKPKEKKGAKKAESEEDEEQAIAASYTRATASYRREMAGKGVDAYGTSYGPEALARACMKALGTGSIRETFGALATLPEKISGLEALGAKVNRLDRNDRASRVEALIGKAKADGVPMPAERRKYLREQGALHGTAHLRGMLAQFPRLATKALEPDEEGSAAQLGSAGADVEKAIAEASALMPKEQRAEFEKTMRASLKANAAKIPAA
jgi:hypothetical protein